MPNLKRVAWFVVFLTVPTVLGQSEKNSLPVNYLIFKVSDQSVDTDQARLDQFLAESYGLTSEVASYSVSYPDLAYRITDGWEFHKYAALEGELIYYHKTDLFVRTTDGDSFRITKQSFAAGLSVAGRYPLMKNLYLYGKAGAAFWRTDSDREGGDGALPDKVHEDNVEPSLGAGVRWSLSSNMVFDLSYEQNQVDGLDVNTITLGIGFRY